MEALFNILTNFLVYISIPAAIRYVILRRPIRSKWIAMLILLPLFVGFATLLGNLREEGQRRIYEEAGIPYRSTPHMIGSPILYVAMLLSFLILRHGKPAGRTISASDVGKNGFTELMHSAASGEIDTVAKLLAAGNPINQQDDQGKTPLMYAAMNDRQEVIRLLLENGADPDVTTRAGRSAAWFAKRQGFDVVLRFLNAHKMSHQVAQQTDPSVEQPPRPHTRG